MPAGAFFSSEKQLFEATTTRQQQQLLSLRGRSVLTQRGANNPRRLLPPILGGNLKYTSDHCESPIPAVPPYFVRTHHIHGTRTTDDTTQEHMNNSTQKSTQRPGSVEAANHSFATQAHLHESSDPITRGGQKGAKTSPRGARGAPERPQEWPGEAHKEPNRRQEEPRRPERSQDKPERSPRGTRKSPRVARRGTKGPKRLQGEPRRYQNEPKSRHERFNTSPKCLFSRWKKTEISLDVFFGFFGTAPNGIIVFDVAKQSFVYNPRNL